MIEREHIEWCDIWVTGANAGEQAKLLLIGDSIARSYFPYAEERLKGEYLCARLTTSKCVGDPSFYNELALLLDDYRFDTIHFNNGLHGWGYSEADYAKGLSETLDFIIHRSRGSRLIWASTTPMQRKDDLSERDPMTDRVVARNRIAEDLAARRRIQIDDLFGLVAGHRDYFAADGVHFNPVGQKALGQKVAEAILPRTDRGAVARTTPGEP
jgi:hypothetical protein